MCAAMPPQLGVVAVGSPMWDTMARVDDCFLEARTLPKGDATPMHDAGSFADLKAAAIAASLRPATQGCGGCACNTAKVLARLLGRDVNAGVVAFSGGIGRAGEATAAVRAGLVACEVLDLLAEADEGDPSGSETGEVLCLVTDDGERTFAYRSGASATLTSSALSKALRGQAASPSGLKMAYFDAYTFLNPGRVAEDGMREAKALGAKVGLNLGSPGIVAEQRNRLWDLLDAGLCDVLAMNEAEARALCEGIDVGGDEPQKLCAAVGTRCELVALTLGAEGLFATFGRGAPPQHYAVRAVVEVEDTTGAGDFFAGGLLAGWLRGMPMEESVRWGAEAAAMVLAVFGTDPGPVGWKALQDCCLGV